MYAQGTYDLDPWISGLKFTAGARYTWDDRFAQSRSLPLGACAAPPPGADAQCTLTSSGSFKAPTWTVGLDYQATLDTLVYLTSRRGYRTGGFNASAQLPQNKKFDPEYVTDVELGVKHDGEIAGRGIRTNVAVFHDKYKNIQTNQTVTEDVIPITVVKNAAAARIVGAEVEATLEATENLRLGAMFSWIDFKYTSSITGADLFHQPNVPKYKYGVNARYRLPVASALGGMNVSANWSWQDDVFITTAVDPLAVQRAYGLLTLGANWDRIAGSPVDASLFMTNATDKTYATGSFSLYDCCGFSGLTYGEPRMYGVRVRYRFGQDE